jgi:hypothetical protein
VPGECDLVANPCWFCGYLGSDPRASGKLIGQMGTSGRVDQATIAFRRVLAEANAGEQARVDALVVLAQRTVYAATWPGQNQAARTLTNSEGESALPLFTGLDVLDSTATRFGWRNPDGSLQFRELGAREALRHALARGVHFVVLDIGCEHSVEFAREELEPLLQLQSQRSGTGPYAATGERQAAILEAVRRSSSRPPHTSSLPGSAHTVLELSGPESNTGRIRQEASARETQPSPPLAAAARRVQSRPLTPAVRSNGRSPSERPSANRQSTSLGEGQAAVAAASPSASVASAASVAGAAAEAEAPALVPAEPSTAADRALRAVPRDDEPTVANRSHDSPLGAPRLALPDELLRGISVALRSFPEVEWACVLSDSSQIPVIALRVDPSFLNRVADITDAIMDVADKQGSVLQAMLLNNIELVKNARRHGKAFYPWQR